MIVFNNWTLTVTGLIARQYDNLSRRIDVEGDLPAGYTWQLLVQLQNTCFHLGKLRGYFRPGAKARQALRDVGAHHVGVTLGDAVSLQDAPQLEIVLAGFGQVVRRQKGACARFRGFQQDGIRISAGLHQQLPGVARREVSLHVDAPGQVVVLPGNQASNGYCPVVK